MRNDTDIAITVEHVSKTYRLYANRKQQLFDVIGLGKLTRRKHQMVREFPALRDINLSIPRGHRVGIIGRNGAGKTTLLKLICGNFAPTSGTIEVNGTIQALMSTGLGFHPEFTGLDNIRASLHYNGLTSKEYDDAVADIVEFCELGEFIDQPFKLYSLGMQARLMFATATAIRPDILIIDEVLGAGDAYFIAKSRARIEKLVESGATMLLVSHSTQQVLELCHEVIWLHEGEMRLQGDALTVVKAYEEYIHGGASSVSKPAEAKVAEPAPTKLALVETVTREPRLQEPPFQPHKNEVTLPEVPDSDATTYRFESRGGISRWHEQVTGLKFCGFSMVTAQGITNRFICLQPGRFVMFVRAEIDGPLSCRFGIAITDLQGNCVTRLFSPVETMVLKNGEIRRVEVTLNPNQLGPGEYVLSVSVFSGTPLEQVNASQRYDLLNRSFSLTIALPDSMAATSNIAYHSAEWQLSHPLKEAA